MSTPKHKHKMTCSVEENEFEGGFLKIIIGDVTIDTQETIRKVTREFEAREQNGKKTFRYYGGIGGGGFQRQFEFHVTNKDMAVEFLNVLENNRIRFENPAMTRNTLKAEADKMLGRKGGLAV